MGNINYSPTVGSLFSGAGLGDLGLEWAGFDHKWFCECDDYARKVLKLRYPDKPVYGDIREVNFKRVEPVDILAGGFPCQDISLAGKGEGITGEKSGLWKEFARAIGEIRPRYALIENSPALVTRGLELVLSDLSALGYNAEWCCLSAKAFEALHERNRFWIVAYTNSQIITSNPCSNRRKRVFPEEIQRVEGLPRFQNIRRLEDLQNRPDVPEPLIRRMADGPASGVDRLKCVGNGQFPACTYFIGRLILKHMEATNARKN